MSYYNNADYANNSSVENLTTTDSEIITMYAVWKRMKKLYLLRVSSIEENTVKVDHMDGSVRVYGPEDYKPSGTTSDGRQYYEVGIPIYEGCEIEINTPRGIVMINGVGLINTKSIKFTCPSIEDDYSMISININKIGGRNHTCIFFYGGIAHFDHKTLIYDGEIE